jgi:hypothetical protein
MFLNGKLTYRPKLMFHRIDVRERVKCYEKEPREECRLEIERLRESLTTDLIRLHSLQSKINHAVIIEADGPGRPHDESCSGSDDDVGEAIPEPGAVPPECRLLHLPSSHNTTINQPFRRAELNLRIKQATRYLSALRDAIAQKSFQYSHVMQAAPSKGARTRT